MSDNANPTATFVTTKGEMTIELCGPTSPRHGGKLHQTGQRRLLRRHLFSSDYGRVHDGKGDPQTKDETLEDLLGTGGLGHTIKAEFNDRPHVRGVISMARSASPDPAGSQFFVCLDNASFLDGQYTTFGALSDGDDTLGAIGATPVGPSNSGENSKPKERVEVTSIRVA